MDRCSVERKCSSAGRACAVDDRGCQGLAASDGLEITCERAATESEPLTYVYCPPGGQQRDSSAVWLLLFVAIAIAAVGAAISVVMLRRNLRS